MSLPDLLPPPLVSTSFDCGIRREGKVRDSYVLEDGRIVLVTTDRISAFDHVLRQAIPLKGQVLNRLSEFFFSATADVAPNALLSAPDPNVSIATACQPLPIEFVMRGYLAGHAARVYASGGRTLCGVTLPEGLREGQALPSPILTPATKAESGHDEDISVEEIRARGLVPDDILDAAIGYAQALFARGTEMAKERGLLLVDTKYEFGLAPDGRVLLIDEVHTPDSSRYYYAESHEEALSTGVPQRQLSKEFVREWLMDQGFRGLDGQVLPDLPDAFIRQIAERYVELYETMTGERFLPDVHPAPEARVWEALAAEGISSVA